MGGTRAIGFRSEGKDRRQVKESLRKGEYYGHPRNALWRIIRLMPRMPNVLTIAFVALCVSTMAFAQGLHRREVNEKNPGGKDLVMTAQELRRDERTSEVKITYRSGASVPSAMFIVHAFYDIARERKAAYFIKLKESKAADGDTVFLVGFSKTDKVAPATYFDVPRLDPATEFMSVEDFAMIFGNAPEEPGTR
jgi:hypothetical protein